MPDVYGPFAGQAFQQPSWYRDRGYVDPSGVAGPASSTIAGGDLGLTASGLNLTVALGRAHVRGAYYERTGTAWTVSVPANTNGTQSRLDRVVLRRDLSAGTVVPALVQGTPAATPTAPTLTQVDTGVWEMALFTVLVPPASGTTLQLFDERLWIDPVTGAASGPFVALSVNSGWAAWGGHTPRIKRTASGSHRLYGGFTNNGAFTANATQFPVQLGTGGQPWTVPLVQPATSQVFVVPFATPASGPGYVIATWLSTSGVPTLRLDSSTFGTIPASTTFFLDALEVTPDYAG